MTPAQSTARLASIIRSPEGEALLAALDHRLEVFNKEMMTTQNANALFSARGAVAALSSFKTMLLEAPALAETLRTNPPA